jgi:hypothetical protein
MYERVHHHWRQRYSVAGDSLANRPKRRGIAWQELRGQAALFIEWLLICWREGWLGSARRRVAAKAKNLRELGEKMHKNLLDFRHELGLTRPYGSKAVALKIGTLEPIRADAAPDAKPGPEPATTPDSS